jgi:hypothetical protein
MGGIEVPDDRDPDRLDGAGTDALREPEHDHHRDGCGQAAEHRSDDEQADAGQQHGLSAVDVGQLSEDDGGRGLREQEGREHPTVEVKAAELRRNLGHGGRDDRRLDGDHEHRRHHRGNHEMPLRGRRFCLLQHLSNRLTRAPTCRSRPKGRRCDKRKRVGGGMI